MLKFSVRVPAPVKVELRNVEDIQRLQSEIADWKDKYTKKDQELSRMALYASLNFDYVDQLREAKKILDDAGLDSSFINYRNLSVR